MPSPKKTLAYPDWSARTPLVARSLILIATESGEHTDAPKTLTPLGRALWHKEWPKMLSEAFFHPEREGWLAVRLVARGFFTQPHDAERIAQQHFKRFYIAAVCFEAIDAGQNVVWYFRAHASTQPRTTSEAKLAAGESADPRALLQAMQSLDRFHRHDLGKHRSGLSVKRSAPSDADKASNARTR